MNKFIANTEDEEKLKKLLSDDLDDDANPDDKLDPISLPRVVKEEEEFSDEEIDKKPVISENGEGKEYNLSYNFIKLLHTRLFYSYKYKRGNFKRTK